MYQTQAYAELKYAHLLPRALTVLRSVGESELIQSWSSLVEELSAAEPAWSKILTHYHRFFMLVAENSWSDGIINLVLESDNTFSRCSAQSGADVAGTEPVLADLAARDLNLLQEISRFTPSRLQALARSRFELTKDEENASYLSSTPLAPEHWPHWEQSHARPDSGLAAAGKNPDRAARTSPHNSAGLWLKHMRENLYTEFRQASSWDKALPALAEYFHHLGFGVCNNFLAFRWRQDHTSPLEGVANPDSIQLEQLIGLEREKGIVTENTDSFLEGRPANNIILYGNRGTGKSSMVKALLQAYASRGLRLVELGKSDLSGFPQAYRLLADIPLKFIIFIDDLSFDETEPEYKALKTLLEGGLAAKPHNVLIYATSNRRHLVKESFAERQGDEINVRDSMEEKLSLADRFGITVTFPAPAQEDYLRIVEGLALQRKLDINPADLRQLALRWEMWHNGRSGRSARQFIDHLTAQLSKHQV
ncbi:ATP-binding protein [Paradesulfitobacterium aromaticivorans]